MTQPLLQAADLLGTTRLTAAGLASLVDAMPAGITALPAPDALRPPHPERDAFVAALNGVLGDHLAATDHPLALTMQFRQRGRPLPLDRHAMRTRLGEATPKLLLLLHGLCMNDLQWHRAGHDHGEALARERGYTPVHLLYNSGLSVSTNGRILAPLMERLYSVWPMPVERLALIGHGMGGLVARSAIHHGASMQRGELRWPGRVADLVCLGSPHLGAPLERAGPGLELLLAGAPGAAALAGLGRRRSAGFHDFQRGHVLAAPAAMAPEPPVARVGLPAGTRCFAMAASLDTAFAGRKSRLAGDGLVPVASALGRHDDAERDLGFAPGRQAVVPGTGHLDLLSSTEAYALLRGWLD